MVSFLSFSIIRLYPMQLLRMEKAFCTTWPSEVITVTSWLRFATSIPTMNICFHPQTRFADIPHVLMSHTLLRYQRRKFPASGSKMESHKIEASRCLKRTVPQGEKKRTLCLHEVIISSPLRVLIPKVRLPALHDYSFWRGCLKYSRRKQGAMSAPLQFTPSGRAEREC